MSELAAKKLAAMKKKEAKAAARAASPDGSKAKKKKKRPKTKRKTKQALASEAQRREREEALADAAATAKHRQDTLRDAAYNGDATLVRQLLHDGADPNHVDAGGQTPLHLAAFWGHQEVAETLLEFGARPNQLNAAGFSPLHVAIQWERVQCADIIRNWGGASQLEKEVEEQYERMEGLELQIAQERRARQAAEAHLQLATERERMVEQEREMALADVAGAIERFEERTRTVEEQRVKHEEGRRKVEQVLSRLHEETRAAKAMQARNELVASHRGPHR